MRLFGLVYVSACVEKPGEVTGSEPTSVPETTPAEDTEAEDTGDETTPATVNGYACYGTGQDVTDDGLVVDEYFYGLDEAEWSHTLYMQQLGQGPYVGEVYTTETEWTGEVKTREVYRWSAPYDAGEEITTWDTEGHQLEYTGDWDGDGTIDARSVEVWDGDHRVTWTQYFGDLVVPAYVSTWVYENDVLVRIEHDDLGDGTVESITTVTHPEPNVELLERDLDLDGVVDSVTETYTERDGSGDVTYVRQTNYYVPSDWSQGHETFEWSYADGVLVHYLVTIDGYGQLSTDEQTYTYDDEGRLVQKRWDSSGSYGGSSSWSAGSQIDVTYAGTCP